MPTRFNNRWIAAWMAQLRWCWPISPGVTSHSNASPRDGAQPTGLGAAEWQSPSQQTRLNPLEFHGKRQPTALQLVLSKQRQLLR